MRDGERKEEERGKAWERRLRYVEAQRGKGGVNHIKIETEKDKRDRERGVD